ncbi:28S ribosomal protein S2, mitochondrial isoform X2 [Choloepus didactylus]|uniref:28S ribosomal protein S2, mitochondrial isoform X2 n=1 Tax=Choloepus didactylus TaxID=27675 RepID=UPI00189FF8DA|nr:28S ribosomal protein S2, mitochondrial isoform X2 [Choloepus didactylus]
MPPPAPASACIMASTYIMASTCIMASAAAAMPSFLRAGACPKSFWLGFLKKATPGASRPISRTFGSAPAPAVREPEDTSVPGLHLLW